MRKPPTSPDAIAVLVAASFALGALACTSEPPAVYEEGLVEGGVLSDTDLARKHYDTRIRPPDEEDHSFLSPDAIETEEGLVRTFVSYSRTYEIDRVITAMVGPRSQVWLDLSKVFPEPELVWIKGISSELVDISGETISPEYMCHVVANVGTPDERDAKLGLLTYDSRFAALAQGLYHKEYPRGFGLPVLSTDRIAYASQVLNYDPERVADGPIRVRHRIVTHLILDRDRKRPMKAIASTYAQALVLLNGEEGEGYFGIRMPDAEVHGASCAVGRLADSMSSAKVATDAYGREFTAHWIIEPGTWESQTLVTNMMNIRYDTAIHSIDTHLHPFGEWVELRDLTTQETIYRATAEQVGNGSVGLEKVQSYRSQTGIPVYADHEYAIVTRYDNTSDSEQDAMAILYMGIHDKEFDPKLLHDAEARARLRARREQMGLQRLTRAVQRDPEDAGARYQLGTALLHMDRPDEAAEQLRASLRLDPQNLQARKALGRALAKSLDETS